MTSVQTYSINPKNLKLKYKEVFDDWDNLICEHEGSFASDCQYMTFDCDGIEVVVDFELCIGGSVYHEKGDYWNPSYTDVEVTSVDVTITSLHIDEWEVELNSELIKSLEKVVKTNL